MRRNGVNRCEVYEGTRRSIERKYDSSHHSSSEITSKITSKIFSKYFTSSNTFRANQIFPLGKAIHSSTVECSASVCCTLDESTSSTHESYNETPVQSAMSSGLSGSILYHAPSRSVDIQTTQRWSSSGLKNIDPSSWFQWSVVFDLLQISREGHESQLLGSMSFKPLEF